MWFVLSSGSASIHPEWWVACTFLLCTECKESLRHRIVPGLDDDSIWLTFVLQSSIFSTLKTATANKLVCYFTKWSQYRTGVGRYLPGDIDPWLCTHLVYAFAVVNYANEITENEWKEHTLYRQFNELKNRYANCSWWTIQHTLQNINICFTNKWGMQCAPILCSI